MYPKVLPRGTVIRIGQKLTDEGDNSISESAVNLEFELIHDMPLVDGEFSYYGETFKSKVIKNPNGWEYGTVTHEVDLKWDTIVSGIENKYMKHQLDHIDN